MGNSSPNSADCPHHGKFIAAKAVPMVRFRALQTIAVSYRPTAVEVSFLQTTLGFSSEGECQEYLTNCGASLNVDKEVLKMPTLDLELHRPEEPVKQSEKTRGVTHSIV